MRLGLLRGDEEVESPDSVAEIGTADTSEIIKAKTSATRPARERKLEYMTIGPADRKMERERTWDFYRVSYIGLGFQKAVCLRRVGSHGRYT